MSKKEEYNIFNQSGQKPEKKEDSSSLSESTRKDKIPSVRSNIIDPELIDMLKRLRFMDDDLKQKMNTLCELTGMSRREIETYIENPKNFSESQWKNAQKDKALLEEKIYKAIGEQAKMQMMKKKKMKIAKERKGKTLGGRKGWIQM